MSSTSASRGWIASADAGIADKIAISNGSACSSAGYSTSHVLRAMGRSSSQIESSVRISWGPGVEQIPFTALIEAVSSLM